MPVYSVDSEAVMTATASVRGTIDRLQSETHAMLSQLTQLQSSWTGGASVAFAAIVDQWRATQAQVEQSLDAINTALTTAGRQYAEAEQFSMSLFR